MGALNAILGIAQLAMVQCDEVSPQPGTLSTQTPTTAYAGVAS